MILPPRDIFTDSESGEILWKEVRIFNTSYQQENCSIMMDIHYLYSHMQDKLWGTPGRLIFADTSNQIIRIAQEYNIGLYVQDVRQTGTSTSPNGTLMKHFAIECDCGTIELVATGFKMILLAPALIEDDADFLPSRHPAIVEAKSFKGNT